MKAVSITVCASIKDDIDVKEWGDAVAKLIAAGRNRHALETSSYEASLAEAEDVECVACEDM